MKKTLGMALLLVAICILTAASNPSFLKVENIQNTVRWTALFSIISIGAALVIISGGIDLSIGSVIGLTGSLLAWMLAVKQWSIPAAMAVVLMVSLLLGVFHGLLVTKLRLQPFIVTLCGLLLYRGFARWLTDDQSQGFGNAFEGLRQLAIGRILGVPNPFWIMLLIALAAAAFLNLTIYGRYLQALGRNEVAARYSGINTDRMKILAYAGCALLAGFGGALFALDFNSVQPASHGAFYELYAIAAAVLGGCSLRGGEGSILGVLIGAAILRVLYNAINIVGIPTHHEFTIIGGVILIGVVVDELVKRVATRRRAVRAAQG